MWSTAREIADGDLVIIWLTREVLQPLLISAGKELNSRFGVYRHSDLIGMPYGSKVGSRNGKGFVHVLRPTPELWTLALPHRTQILYLPDIAFVTSWLDIKPGSRVIEAGTGSASFSHSTARTIGPQGHLWSYEFHEARANKAREEFSRHGLDNVVTLTHRNVCKDGFTVEDTVDAAPWDAIPHARKALRKDRTTRICCFSPCMEQVMRTVTALNENGFTDITMYETLLRPHQVDEVPRLPSISTAAERLKRLEVRKEEKRLKQIAMAHRGKRKREEGPTQEEETSTDAAATKRAKTEESEDADSQMVAATTSTAHGTQTPAEEAETVEPEPEKISLSKIFPEVKGHTSYLTFAVLVPLPTSQPVTPNEEQAESEPAATSAAR